MKRSFIQLAGTALAAFLLFFVSQTNAQTDGSGVIIRVNIDGVSSDYYQGTCGYAGVAWGGAVTDAFCAPAKKVNDVLNSPLVCDSIADGLLSGNIAVVDRGVCALSDKSLNAQKAGAVGILIIQAATNPADNCVATTAGAGPEAPQVTIPVFVICRNIGNQITTALAAGKTVEVCFVQPDIDITDYFFPVSHVQTPVTQIAKDTFGFSATLSNAGTVARTNIVVTAKVLKSDGTELYSTSVTIPELAPGVVDSFIEIPGLYPPELLLGSYQIVYTTKADAIGGVPPVQDRGFGNFFVTQNLFANDNGATNGYRPSAGGDWAAGALYTMQAGALEKYEVKQVEFAFATNATDYPVSDVQATLYFFKINDDVLTDYSNFDDTELISSSFEWLGLAAYDAPDNITSYTLQKVEMTDLISGTVGIKVEAGSRYMVVASYTAPTNLTFAAFNQNVDLPGVSTTVFSDTWFLGGFGAGIESVVRMYIDLAVKTDEKPLPQSVMQIMPNPVRDNLNLALQFDQPTDATITIADINGRVVTFEDRQGLTNETLRYPLQVAAGTYLARIATKEGTLTKQFVVVK